MLNILKVRDDKLGYITNMKIANITFVSLLCFCLIFVLDEAYLWNNLLAFIEECSHFSNPCWHIFDVIGGVLSKSHLFFFYKRRDSLIQALVKCKKKFTQHENDRPTCRFFHLTQYIWYFGVPCHKLWNSKPPKLEWHATWDISKKCWFCYWRKHFLLSDWLRNNLPWMK